MRESFLDVNQEQLKKASNLAAILCEDEANPEDAKLAFTFYYSLDENRDELETIMSHLMLGED
jgi:hypothetical protein